MRKIPGETATDQVDPAHLKAEDVASLLVRWQIRHEQDDFAALVSRVREPLARLTERTLRRSGVRDPAACEDAVALVLERLYRLGTDVGKRTMPAFVRDRVDRSAVDPGWTYVRCVARSRARDVARTVRRRARLVADYAASAAAPRPADDDGGHTVSAVDIVRLRAAVATLDEQSREVMELLLDGKNQAVIAHVLGVCEGTVSRIRARAIARLRALLAEKAGGGGG